MLNEPYLNEQDGYFSPDRSRVFLQTLAGWVISRMVSLVKSERQHQEFNTFIKIGLICLLHILSFHISLPQLTPLIDLAPQGICGNVRKHFSMLKWWGGDSYIDWIEESNTAKSPTTRRRAPHNRELSAPTPIILIILALLTPTLFWDSPTFCETSHTTNTVILLGFSCAVVRRLFSSPSQPYYQGGGHFLSHLEGHTKECLIKDSP